MPTTTTSPNTTPQVIDIQARINDQDNQNPDSSVDAVENLDNQDINIGPSRDTGIMARVSEYRLRIRELVDARSFSVPTMEDTMSSIKSGIESITAKVMTGADSGKDKLKSKIDPVRERYDEARRKTETSDERLERLFETEGMGENSKAILAETVATLEKFEEDHPGQDVSYYKQQSNRIYTEIVKDICGLDKKPNKGDPEYEKFSIGRKNLIIYSSYVRTGNLDAARLLLGEDFDAPDWAEAPKRSLSDEFLYRKVQIKSAWNEIRSKGFKETWKEDMSKKQKAVAVLAMTAAGVAVGYATYKGVEFISDAASGSADASGLAEGSAVGGSESSTDLFTLDADGPFGGAESTPEPAAPSEMVTEELQTAVDSQKGGGEGGFLDLLSEGQDSIVEYVSNGEGVTDQLMQLAENEGINLTSSESYDMYQYLRAEGLLDSLLADGTLYEMPNGDLGIAKPGNMQLSRDILEGMNAWVENRG